MEQSANGFEGPVADSWTILQPAKDRNVHSQLLYRLAPAAVIICIIRLARTQILLVS